MAHYNIVVGITSAPGAVAQIGEFEQKLDDTSAAADRTTAALGEMSTAGAAAGEQLAQGGGRARNAMDDLADAVRTAAGATTQLGTASGAAAEFTLRELQVLERIASPAREWGAELVALNNLLQLGAIATADYEAQLIRAQETYGATDRAESLLAAALKRETQLLEQIQTPMLEYQQDLAALDALLKRDQLSLEQYDAALAKVQRRAESAGAIAPIQGPAFDPNQAGRGMTAELQRERELLEQINAPMLEYQAQLKALGALLAKDTIDLEQYDRELAKAQKRAEAGGALAPVQGPKQQESGSSNGGGGGSEGGDPVSAMKSLASGANAILAGGAAAGVISLAEHLAGLLSAYRDVQDVAIKAANAVQRFTDETHSATLVMDQQMELAKKLHADYAQTVTLYGRLAESADAMSLSQSEVTTLTKEFGEAVQLAGKPLEAADGIMRRLAYSMAAGKIETREMRSIMREMPPIADLWTKAFGATRQQLIEMVKDGRVSTEDLMGVLLRGSQAIEDKFSKLRETHAQNRDRWIEDEKILSQRYDVGFGTGHATQGAVEGMAMQARASAEGWKQVADEAERGGLLADIAAAALQRIRDEDKAAISDTINDLMHLTGAFRPVGDVYRKWVGDTAAVRAEVQKLNEPLAAARSELATLDKAFEIGQIDVDTYNKRYNELLTTINHGIGSQAFKILEPIRQAKLELAMLNNEIEAGANITQAEYRRAMTQYETASHGGVVPEDLKLSNPVLDARDAMADLVAKQKEGKITAEAFRKEYDALITTINDGRLPSAIKLWESFTLPIRDWRDDIAGLTSLFDAGRISLLKYTDEYAKLVHTQSAFIQAQTDERQLERWMQQMPEYLRQRMQVRTALGGSVNVLPDTRELLDQHRAIEEANRRSDGLIDARAPRSLTDVADVQKALTTLKEMNATLQVGSEQWAKYNQQEERVEQLSNQLYAPAVKYEQILGDIARAVEVNSLTEEQAVVMRRHAREEFNNETEALQKVSGPLGDYEAAARHLNNQQEIGRVSAQKYAEGIDKARESLLEGTGAAKTFSGAMEINWIHMKQEAESFGATLANMAVADFGKLNDAIVSVANGAQVSWSQMADSMIQDLERIFLKAEETKLINALVGLGSSASGASAGSSAMDAALVDEFAQGMGYANGGRFMVGGSGGTDSKYVGMRVTPGEMITVSTPAQQQSTRAAPHQAPPPVVVQPQIHNHYDNSMMVGALTSPIGQSAVLNVLRANPSAVRSALGIR